MFALDQTLAGGYHVAELRSQARRDGLARQMARRRLSSMLRRPTR